MHVCINVVCVYVCIHVNVYGWMYVCAMHVTVDQKDNSNEWRYRVQGHHIVLCEGLLKDLCAYWGG